MLACAADHAKKSCGEQDFCIRSLEETLASAISPYLANYALQ